MEFYSVVKLLVVSDVLGGFVCVSFFVQSRAGSNIFAFFVFTNASMNYRVSSQVDRVVWLSNVVFFLAR